MTILLTALVLVMIVGAGFAVSTMFDSQPINEDGYRTYQFNAGAVVFVVAWMLFAGVIAYG